MKKLILFYIGLTIVNFSIQAQTVTLSLKGKVTYVDDRNSLLKNAVKVDDVITCTIKYYTNIADNSVDTTVGNYNNTANPAGMYIKIGDLTFQTDPKNVNFLVEAVCRPSNNSGNAIVFHSYNNAFQVGNEFTNKMISWQLDDFFGKALKNDSLFHKIDLNKFEQISGLTISADSVVYMNRYFIRGMITEVTSTVKDLNNTVISVDTSILVVDNSPIKVDTTTNSVTDFDGNLYKTVKIGEQTWLRENLKSIHYADGTPIADVHAYNDDEKNAAIYGRLYTWEATMHSSISSIDVPSGVQGVCPVGWHVPSDNEWYTLIKYLGGNALAGAKMKEKGTEYWISPNEGAENTSFFTVKPAGSLQSGKYYYLGFDAAFWSSSDYNSSKTYARYVFLSTQTTNAVVFNDGNKSSNLSIRCIKDLDIIPTPSPDPGSNPIPNPIPSPDPIPSPSPDPIPSPEPTKDNAIATTINRDVDNSSFDIYPNPVGQILFLKGLPQNGNVFVFDVSGKMVINQPMVNNAISVLNLKNGIYMLKIVDKSGVTIKKFVKE